MFNWFHKQDPEFTELIINYIKENNYSSLFCVGNYNTNYVYLYDKIWYKKYKDSHCLYIPFKLRTHKINLKFVSNHSVDTYG